MSYDIKLYERTELRDRCLAKCLNLMWHDYLNQFEKGHPVEFKIEENKLHEEKIALALLANSNKDKYGHIVAELHDDYLKIESHYPADMSAMCKLSDEHSNDKKAIDPDSAGAPHLAFAQRSLDTGPNNKQLKCRKCGLENYTIYTCPKYNKKNKFKNDRQ